MREIAQDLGIVGSLGRRRRAHLSIVRIHDASRGTYGRPRICAEPRYEGTRCSAKRVARLMRAAGISGIPARRRRRGLTRRRPGVAPPPRPWWGAGSPRRHSTGCGWPTSPTSPPARVGVPGRLHSSLGYLSPAEFARRVHQEIQEATVA
ncbi:MAG: IS3 family transposase [Actinomycetota bacterium]